MTPDEFQARTGAGDRAMTDLAAYAGLVAETNAVMNLVGPATIADFWSRHAFDSAQLLPHAPSALTWADLGAGAGLPGVVLAILLKGRDGAHVHLIDSQAKRCRFLDQVVGTLDLPATVHNVRAESLDLTVDVVTARACAPLDRLLGYSARFFENGAQGLFLKGENAEAELRDARKSWRVEADLIPSLSDARGRILRIRSLHRGR